MEPWAFDSASEEWKPLSSVSSARAYEPPSTLGAGAAVVTLNCLFDQWHGTPYKPSVVRSTERFTKICSTLEELDADIVTLNEVTQTSLEFFEKQAWIREKFFISGRDSSGEFPAFGNVILSKMPPKTVRMVKLRRLKRPVVLASFGFQKREDEETIHIAICAAHLSALASRKKVRRRQLEQLVGELGLDSGENSFDAVVIQGDLNFHSEKENASIPPGFEDGWMACMGNEEEGNGFTFDALRNPMIPRMWPLGNEHRRMRLDRVLLWAGTTGLVCTDMAIEFDRLVYSNEYPQKPASMLDKASEVISSVFEMVGLDPRRRPEKYLMCSDHFGIRYTLALKD